MLTAKNFIATFLIVCIAPVFATEPDLVLQKDITPEYIVYLAQKEATYLYQTTLSPTRGDNTLTMQAHMGLAILQAAWTHVNGDTLVADVEDLLNDAGDNAENIGVRIFDDILPILESGSRQEFFDKLIDFFESGTYPDFRDSVGNYLDNIAYDIEEIEDDADEEDQFTGQSKTRKHKVVGKRLIQLTAHVIFDFLKQNDIEEDITKLREFSEFLQKGILKKTDEDLYSRKELSGPAGE